MGSTSTAKKAPRPIRLAEALLIFVVSIFIIGYAALSGAFPTAMGIFLALIICAAYGMAILHYTWDDLFDNVVKTIASVLFGLLFCMSVGFISAAWLASGTIPFMLYWGLEFINPNIFLLVAFVSCAIASFATGQAWTMIPSLGLAYIGIAGALGIPLPLAAGAIVGGCFIGDAASPLCEVPTIASISAGTKNVMGTIKGMLPTMGVGFVAACVGYLIIGSRFGGAAMGGASSALELQSAVAAGFNLTPLTLLPLILVFVLVFIKFPILPAVTLGALLGVLEAVVLQGMSFGDVTAMMWSGYVANTGDAALDALLSRGGIMDFAGTVIMLLFAFAFAGIIQKMGVLEIIMEGMLKIVRSRGLLITCTSVTAMLGVALTGSANVSSLLNGNVYKDAYRKMKLDPTNLARTMAMNGSVINSMLPWTASGALCFSALGVNPFLYWPYMICFWVTLVLNIVWAFLGRFTPALAEEDSLEGAEA